MRTPGFSENKVRFPDSASAHADDRSDESMVVESDDDDVSSVASLNHFIN